MSVEEAGELARRAIYHATFRDGASGGCVSGMFLSTFVMFLYPVSVLFV
jgi:20S proteasome alpha/beta subunit